MASDGTERRAIQIGDANPAKLNKALNAGINFARGMSKCGDFCEVEIAAFNAGLHMLRTDASPIVERITSISVSIPEVTHKAFGKTIARISKKEGTALPISEHAGVVT